jgi:hypothetical protein
MIIDNRPKLVGILVIRWLIIDTILETRYFRGLD